MTLNQMTLEEKYLYIEISVCAIASWAKDWSLRMKYDKSKNFTYNEGRMDRCIVASLLASSSKLLDFEILIKTIF